MNACGFIRFKSICPATLWFDLKSVSLPLGIVDLVSQSSLVCIFFVCCDFKLISAFKSLLAHVYNLNLCLTNAKDAFVIIPVNINLSYSFYLCLGCTDIRVAR